MKLYKKCFLDQNIKERMVNLKNVRIFLIHVKSQSAHLNADHNNIDRRHRFIIERRNYRRAIYSAKRISKVKQIEKLSKLEKFDAKSFWKGLMEIISPKESNIENIEKKEWLNHFDKVFNEPAARGTDNQFLEYVKTSLPILENNTIYNEYINGNITESEIINTIKDLKPGKAIFTDNIGNEALRHGYVYFKESLTHMFNNIFKSGQFPKSWADGLIIPLHKKGDKTDVNNYRGIIISSCVSKILLRIITKRIDKYMVQAGKWSIFQFCPHQL